MTAVREASPDAVSLDDAFKEAMTGPAKPREVPPPPEVDNDAPHGRDPGTGEPLAPYGLTKAGKPRKSPAGRPPKEDQARTAPAPSLPDTAGDKKAPAKPGAAYGQALDEFGDALWIGGSVLAEVGPGIPLVGKYVPGQKLAAASGIFHVHKPRLVAAVCLAADHSQRARRLAEKIDTGDATWAVVAGMLVLPCIQELVLVMRGDKALAAAEAPSLAELAEKNEAKVNEYMSGLRAAMEAQADTLAQQAGGEAA